jgi:hypothetical protein
MQMAEDLLQTADSRSLDETTLNDLSTKVYPFLKKSTYTRKRDMKSVLLDVSSTQQKRK